MRKTTFIDAVYTQTEGETTCIINGQFLFPGGTTLLQKREHFKQRFDWIRKAIINEPRGHNDLFGALIVPSSTPEADVGIIWIDGDGYGDMCGHGTIATSMVMTAFDLTPNASSPNIIRIETPAGIVVSEVHTRGDEVEWCRFENVPAFLAEADIPVELPGLGTVMADIAFGGNYFVTIPLPPEFLEIGPENGALLSRLGVIAKQQINEKIKLVHPEKPHITEIDLVTFYQDSKRADAFYRCVHTYRNGKMDRSPGGTGTSAMLAMLEARGRIKVGQVIQAEGLLGSGTFEGCIVRETTVAGHRAVVPTVKGRSTLVGFGKWHLDPNDVNGRGYTISTV
jgi:proline racemase